MDYKLWDYYFYTTDAYGQFNVPSNCEYNLLYFTNASKELNFDSYI